MRTVLEINWTQGRPKENHRFVPKDFDPQANSTKTEASDSVHWSKQCQWPYVTVTAALCGVSSLY